MKLLCQMQRSHGKRIYTPADGEWLALEQIYQKIYGSYQIDNVAVPIEGGWLRGEEIRFTVNSVAYTGRISGNSMAGVAEGSITCEWRATLVSQ